MAGKSDTKLKGQAKKVTNTRRREHRHTRRLTVLDQRVKRLRAERNELQRPAPEGLTERQLSRRARRLALVLTRIEKLERRQDGAHGFKG